MRHRVVGWFLTVTGVLACPCHLVITLPLAVALLGGTALGGWIATHEGAIAVGAGVYFVGALAVGMTLLSLRRVVQSGSGVSGVSCALPTIPTVADARRTADVAPTSDERGPSHAGGDLDCCSPNLNRLDRRHIAPRSATSEGQKGQTSRATLERQSSGYHETVGSRAMAGKDA